MTEITVAVQRLPHAEGLSLPAYATTHSAGLDLLAAIAAPIDLAPGERRLIPTGLKIALPDGYEAQVRPRSGLALKHGITVLNSPGTIDADYRGEVGIILVNLGQQTFAIQRGERIAQMVVAPISRLAWREQTEDLATTQRGDGGFGSTGVAATPRVSTP
jgi:dUTP pyrophosphatase